jgi:hypothetical protein
VPSISTIADLASGDVIPESWVDAVKDDVNYHSVAGADLASGATLTITNSFHKVTGAVTIDNISHAAPVSGQQVRIWCASALTIRNNGGGAGNIRTLTGADRSVRANEIVALTYDGTVWRAGPLHTDFVTALPASPGDGDEVVLTDSLTAPTYAWRMKYLAGAAKWVFVGGAEADSLGTSASTASTGYTTLAGAPSITVPAAGSYDISFGFQGYNATTGDDCYMAPKLGAAAASDNDAVHNEHTSGNLSTSARTVRKTGIAAAAAIVLQARVNAGTGNFNIPWLRVKPVLLG